MPTRAPLTSPVADSFVWAEQRSQWLAERVVEQFARDGGAFLARRNSKSADRETAVQLWEASWKAYQDAWKLAPDKPHLYNDGAVLLHYYLEREYDHAFELYDKAYEMASAQLEEGGLSEEDRALVELAKRDSKDNAEKLRKKIEEWVIWLQERGAEVTMDQVDDILDPSVFFPFIRSALASLIGLVQSTFFVLLTVVFILMEATVIPG